MWASSPQKPGVIVSHIHTHTHTHPFNGPLSGTTQVSRCQKGKTNLDCTEARDSNWQWHQLGHIQVCTSLQTDNHASTPSLSFYRPSFLPPNQQRKSTEGTAVSLIITDKCNKYRKQCGSVNDTYIWCVCADSVESVRVQQRRL